MRLLFFLLKLSIWAVGRKPRFVYKTSQSQKWITIKINEQNKKIRKKGVKKLKYSNYTKYKAYT